MHYNIYCNRESPLHVILYVDHNVYISCVQYETSTGGPHLLNQHCQTINHINGLEGGFNFT